MKAISNSEKRERKIFSLAFTGISEKRFPVKNMFFWACFIVLLLFIAPVVSAASNDTAGVFRSGIFYLKNSNVGGPADTVFGYGNPTDTPVVGDWIGQGIDTPGVFRNGIFYLRNSNTGGPADTVFGYGNPTDIPVVGDWTGQTNSTTGFPIDTVGVFRNGVVYLRNSNTGGPADIVFGYGNPTDVPVVGQWTSSQYPSPAAVNLATAGNYAILAETTVTTTGVTNITGNVGLSAGTSLTGFGLVADSSNQFSTSSLVNGKLFAANYAPPTPAVLTTAENDMGTAYTDGAGRAPDVTNLGAGNIGGLTITPGVYKWGTGVTIPSNTDVTLSGGPNDVWIFEIAGTLTANTNTQVILSGGAQAKNVYWVVAGQTALNGPVFNGNILDQTAISMTNGVTLNGRALAQSAVTLIGDNVTSPVSSPTAPTFVSATTNVAGTAVNVTFSKPMITVGTPSNYTVMVGSNPDPVTGVALNATTTTIDLTLTNAVTNGQTVTVAYTGTNVISGDGGVLASFTAQSVTNAVPSGGSAPTFVSATTNVAGTAVNVTFSKAMSDVGTYGDYNVTVGVVRDPVTGVALDATTTTIDLTLTTAVTNGQTVTMAYNGTDVTSGDGGVLANFTGESVTNAVPAAGPQSSVNLATAGNFAVLDYSALTNSAPSTIIGNVGSASGSITGGGTVTNGTIYPVGGSVALQGQTDLAAAISNAQGRTGAIPLPAQLGGLTLTPGLYNVSSTALISPVGGNLTLNAEGNSSAVWIFQVPTAITTNGGNGTVLENGAESNNVFWDIGSSATIGDGTPNQFNGTILAVSSITLNGATLNGRALAHTGAVTLTGTDTVTNPTAATIPITAIAAPTGTVQVGDQLTAGALTPSGATATYQWQISSTSGGTYTAIPGATSSTYTPGASNATMFIEVVATGTGSYSGTATSTYVGPVAATPVTILTVPSVVAPVSGASPVRTITDNGQYSGTVTWSPTVTTTFVASTVYTATITLTADTGYTFTGVGSNAFTVSGCSAPTNTAGSGTITALFPST